MKRFRLPAFIIATISLVYLIWLAWPHMAGVEVVNRAGITDSDMTEILNHLEADHAFWGRGQLATLFSSAYAPWTRPHYFVEIEGDEQAIMVTAGYVRGELWGGGPIIPARKINGRWVFEKSTMMWRS